MGLNGRKLEGVEVLAVDGRFDAHVAPGVAAWAADFGARGPVNAVVDLAAATFIDSAALSSLVSGLKRCRQSGGDLYLCGLAGPVQVIFELTRLNKAFTIYPDLATAVAVHRANGGPR